MFNILNLKSPAYLFRPQQVLKRLWRDVAWRTATEKIVRLPWGTRLIVNPQEAIGCNIARQGLYEPAVTEALWTLTDPGDLAVDGGANIGYTTSILLARAGATGRVLSFEPHPEIFSMLARNVELWRRDGLQGNSFIHQKALEANDGTATLRTDDWFLTNKGTAWLDSEFADGIKVRVCGLDSVVGETEKIGVLKLDVQGSELNVLRGMERLLSRGAVRDIVFEEMAPFPAATHLHLNGKGYSVSGIEETVTGVRLIPNGAPRCDPKHPTNPNYLATTDQARAAARLDRKMWTSFGLGAIWQQLLRHVR